MENVLCYAIIDNLKKIYFKSIHDFHGCGGKERHSGSSK